MERREFLFAAGAALSATAFARQVFAENEPANIALSGDWGEFRKLFRKLAIPERCREIGVGRNCVDKQILVTLVARSGFDHVKSGFHKFERGWGEQ